LSIQVDQATTAIKKSPLPDVGDIVFVLILELLLFGIPYYMFGDGSTGWHLVTGNYILDQHTVPTTDIMSYTFSGKPWVAYEWLSDAIMAGIVRIAGLPGLAVAIASLIASIFLVLYERCRRAGAHFAIVLPMILIGAIASSNHWLVRPHLFTWLGVLILSGLLESYHRDKLSKRMLWLLVALTMLFWVNLHPAFLLSFVMMFIYFCAELLIALCKPEDRLQSLQRAHGLGICMAVGFFATLLNPYGASLYVYIKHYLQGSIILANTMEFQPPQFGHGLQPYCLEIILALISLSLCLSARRPSLPQFLTVLAFAHLALSSVRNAGVFVIVALPLIAEQLAAWQTVVGPSRISDAWRKIGRVFDENESLCTMHILPIVAVVGLFAMAVFAHQTGGPSILKSGFDPEHMPNQTIQCLNELDAAKGFNYDNWGGYIRYRSGRPVFIDDRADFYGERFYLEYAAASRVDPDWRNVLDHRGVEWVLFPKNSRLAGALKQEPGWKVRCEDGAAYLFVRETK
jgi:hypothetical protein